MQSQEPQCHERQGGRQDVEARSSEGLDHTMPPHQNAGCGHAEPPRAEPLKDVMPYVRLIVDGRIWRYDYVGRRRPSGSTARARDRLTRPPAR